MLSHHCYSTPSLLPASPVEEDALWRLANRIKPNHLTLSLLCMAFLSSSCGVKTKPRRHDCTRYDSYFKECKFETRGTISFEVKDGNVKADIHQNGGQEESKVYWPEMEVPYSSINTTRTYGLQYLETRIAMGPGHGDLFDTILIGITDRGRSIYDASICPLHHQVMERQIEQRVSYEDYDHGSGRYFKVILPTCPNAGKDYLQVCGAEGTGHMTWRCPTCYRINREWEIKHGIKQQNRGPVE